MSVMMDAVKGCMHNNEYWVGSLSFPAIEMSVKLPEDEHWDTIFLVFARKRHNAGSTSRGLPASWCRTCSTRTPSSRP